MRVCPVAVFAYESPELVRDLAEKSARVTHTHEDGVEGAAIQASAIGYILRLAETKTAFDLSDFCWHLINETQSQTFKEKLLDLERFLDNESCEGLELQDLDHFAEKVKNMFGNGVKAEESVLAALAAFAYVAKQGLSTQGAFKQVINLSIAIGGDADTIASMAGAMAGALYGTARIPQEWIHVCEGASQVQELGRKLAERDAKVFPIQRASPTLGGTNLAQAQDGHSEVVLPRATAVEPSMGELRKDEVTTQQRESEARQYKELKARYDQLEAQNGELRAQNAELRGAVKKLSDKQRQENNELAQLRQDGKQLIKDKELLQKQLREQPRCVFPVSKLKQMLRIRWMEGSSRDGPWREVDKSCWKELDEAFWGFQTNPTQSAVTLKSGLQVDFKESLARKPTCSGTLTKTQTGQTSFIKPFFFQNPRSRFNQYPLVDGEAFTIRVKPREHHQGTWEELHFREAESQFLRMLEQTQLLPANQKAIVTEVEIVLIHKANQGFWATVTAETKNNGKKDIIFWGFHGTDDAGIDGIKKFGFKVNHAQTGKNGQTLSLKSIQCRDTGKACWNHRFTCGSKTTSLSSCTVQQFVACVFATKLL